MSFELVGEPLGLVYPPRPAPGFPTLDARTAALKALREFLATLVFRVPGAKDTHEVIAFSVKRSNIFIEWPDNVVDIEFPSITILPGRATYSYLGLGPGRICEDTYGKFAPGTVLMEAAELVEPVVVETWSSKIPERRAMMAGLELAFMLTSDSGSNLRLRLPNYFDLVAAFALDQRELVDDADAARNRRRGHLYVTLTVPVVRLVNANTLLPYVDVRAQDSGNLAC